MNAKFTQILSLLVGLLVLSATALYAQPANNECSGAIDISDLFDGNTNTSTLFDNTGATNEASDPAVTNGAQCFAEGGQVGLGTIDNSIWFSFVGDGNPYIIRSIECTATNYITLGDTQFALYTGDCGNLAAAPNGCNEDAPTATGTNFFAEITVETVAGTTYFFMVDGFNDGTAAATGEFCLEVEPTNIITACDAGTPTTTGAVEVNGDIETFDLAVENFSVPNSPTQGQYWWIFVPSANAAGGPFAGGAFGQRTTGMDTFNSTLNGTSPALTGTWEVFSRVTSDLSIGATCDESAVFLTILFDATPIVDECSAGTLTTNDVVFVNDANPTFTVTSTDRIIPFDGTVGGGYSWQFTPGPDGTGSGPFSFGIINTASSTYTADLNGVLPNELGGTWIVRGQMSTDGTDINAAAGTVCDVTTDSLTVIFALPDPETGCDAGVLTTTTPVDVPIGGTFTINVDNDTVPNTPDEGSYGYFLTPINGGSGGLGGEFIVFANGGTNVWDNTLSGLLGANPPLAGEWVFRGTVFSNIDDPFNTVCSQTTDSLIVNFEAEMLPCAAGSLLSTATQIVCQGNQATIGVAFNTDSIPQGGGFGWIVDDAPGGTGLGGAILLPNAPMLAVYDNTLQGNSATPLEGAFSFRGAVYTNINDPVGTLCSISTDSVLVIYGDVVELQIVENGLELTADVGGANASNFTYAWSTGEDTQVITAAAAGDFSVTITDGIGCTTEASTTLVSTNEADIVNSLSVSPNPTSGLLTVALDLPASQEVQLSVIDITGKEVLNLAPVTFANRNFEVDIQDQAAGLYLLRFRIGDDVVTRRVVKN